MFLSEDDQCTLSDYKTDLPRLYTANMDTTFLLVIIFLSSGIPVPVHMSSRKHFNPIA